LFIFVLPIRFGISLGTVNAAYLITVILFCNNFY